MIVVCINFNKLKMLIMNNKGYDFGMIGLGVMGCNFIFNVLDNGFLVVGLDFDVEKVVVLEKEGEGKLVMSIMDIVIFVKVFV